MRIGGVMDDEDDIDDEEDDEDKKLTGDIEEEATLSWRCTIMAGFWFLLDGRRMQVRSVQPTFQLAYYGLPTATLEISEIEDGGILISQSS